MKAAILKEFGPIENFKITETPSPKFKEVLVKVLASSINPVDFQIRLGDSNNELTLPVITGHVKSIIQQKFLTDKEAMHNIT